MTNRGKKRVSGTRTSCIPAHYDCWGEYVGPCKVFHRKDGQQVHSLADGSKEWRLDGELHRKGGPAAVRADGTQEWYRNGYLHREDGPAYIYPNGSGAWYLMDKELTKAEFDLYLFNKWVNGAGAQDQSQDQVVQVSGGVSADVGTENFGLIRIVRGDN